MNRAHSSADCDVTADPDPADDLEALKEVDSRIGIGVVDIKINHIETPDEIAKSIETAESALGVDLRAGVWHTFVILKPDTVVYEVKSGPFAPTSDKDFAPWAPRPDAPDAEKYLSDLVGLF